MNIDDDVWTEFDDRITDGDEPADPRDAREPGDELIEQFMGDAADSTRRLPGRVLT